jgi:hypothetical protein
MKNEIEIISKEKFKERYNPVLITKELRSVKSCKDLINDDQGVAFYKKHLGEEEVVLTVEVYLSMLNESLNVHGKLTPFQVKDIATELIYTFFWFSIKEFAYVFQKAKRGEYGPINYSIDMPKIFEWFRAYDKERSSTSEQMRVEESREYKKTKVVIDKKMYDKGLDIHEIQLKALKDISDNIPEKFNEEEYKEFKKQQLKK